MTNTDFVKRYMGYVDENVTASRYNTRWESTSDEAYYGGVCTSARGSSKSNIDDLYRLLIEYDRISKGSVSTSRTKPKELKFQDSYPKGDIGALLGLEDS